MDQPVLLVDGLNLYTRHFVANPSMSDLGNHVGGVVGFLRAIQYLCDITKPYRVYVVWEGGGSKRKRDLYKNYKKGSKPRKMNRYYSEEDIPDSLNNRNYQLKTLIDILSKLPVCQIYVEDAEADDAIGYICQYKLSKK